MGINLVKGQHAPLRPKRLRKIYRTAADLAGLGDDKARQLIGQDTGNRSSGIYLETSREMQERTYMKVERKIWIFKEPELSAKEKETTKYLRAELEQIQKDKKSQTITKYQNEFFSKKQQEDMRNLLDTVNDLKSQIKDIKKEKSEKLKFGCTDCMLVHDKKQCPICGSNIRGILEDPKIIK